VSENGRAVLMYSRMYDRRRLGAAVGEFRAVGVTWRVWRLESETGLIDLPETRTASQGHIR
jgi:hypothetical protein